MSATTDAEAGHAAEESPGRSIGRHFPSSRTPRIYCLGLEGMLWFSFTSAPAESASRTPRIARPPRTLRLPRWQLYPDPDSFHVVPQSRFIGLEAPLVPAKPTLDCRADISHTQTLQSGNPSARIVDEAIGHHSGIVRRDSRPDRQAAAGAGLF
jgi:hypothetical protein